jgi:general L-amino acid transport system ATP-binding protein
MSGPPRPPAQPEEVANRMVYFDHGQIVEQGPPEQIFEHPQHERTRQFLSQILH